MTTVAVILIVVGVGLVVVDLFFHTEALAFAGWGVAAAGAAVGLPGEGLWNILEWCFAMLVGCALHWLVVRRVVAGVMTPDRFHAGSAGLEGKRGRVRLVEEQWFVEVGGDLWPLEDAGGFEDGRDVVVESVDGELRLRAAGN